MRTYELMTIAHARLDDAAVQAVVDRFSKLITDQGGSIDKVDHWGRRSFAYEIDHQTEGHYTVFEFQLSSEGLFELERQLRLADEIVRHKVVRPGVRLKSAS